MTASGNTAPIRQNESWLGPLERPALLWLAARLPAGLTPDGLTAIGFLGATMAAVAYAFSGRQPALLWLASVGLAINWFGDSLDGSVARLRRIERPRYGFFLDQSIDALEQLLVCVGWGLSGYVRFELAMIGLAVYFMTSVLALLRATVTSVFNIAYGGIGLTELRCMFIAANGLLFFIPPTAFQFAGATVAYPDFLAIAWTVGAIGTYVFAMAKELRSLARQEPPQRRSIANQAAVDATDEHERAVADRS